MTIYLTIPEGKQWTAIVATYVGARLVSITRLSDGSAIPVKPAVRRRIELVRVKGEGMAA